MEQKIPKIIHFCWFGGNPLPPLARKCIASWKKHCPDYKIIKWDEKSFDINFNDYVREAYEAKKWAFVSDVARLYALVNFGGVYMDTDVEVIKPIDPLLGYEAVSGFESDTRISTSLMAARKGQPFMKELLEQYDTASFKDSADDLSSATNVIRITNTCLKYGFVPNNKKQTVKGFTILPKDYLCPKDQDTAIVNITDNTLVIHHFNGSWLSKKDRCWIEFDQKFNRVLPKPVSGALASYCTLIVLNGVIKGHLRLPEMIFKKLLKQRGE